MKKLVSIALMVNIFTACNLVADKDTTISTVDSNSAFNPVRDLSITAANAYSDLFLDSAAVEKYIKENSLSDTIARDLRNFYLVRNYQYAWMASDGFTEQGRGILNIKSGTDSSSGSIPTPDPQFDSLLAKDSFQISPTDSAFVKKELELTKEFITYARNNFTNTPYSIYYFVPARKQNPIELADSILNGQKDSMFAAGSEAYSLMKQQLSHYYNIVKNGGWQPLKTGNLKKGVSSQEVVALKKRLQITGDYSASDTSQLFNDSLVTAVKEIQGRYGLQPTGMVNDSLITMLNIPAENRLEQIIINMQRTAWMPISDSLGVHVNIPSYSLYVKENGQKTLEMPVIVGKEGSSTIMFSGNISEVVFNPSWNIPQSIVKDEIMPKMKADPNYLKKNNMTLLNEKDSIPQIRQQPGKDNPLGKVKFLFPNNYDIYLHDTPDKQLFTKKDRALSHGCIRVADAPALAVYVLKDQMGWSQQKINEAMNSGKEQTVKVTRPVPVNITYYTAWIDEKGRLNFRDDVYGFDSRTADKLFKRTI